MLTYGSPDLKIPVDANTPLVGAQNRNHQRLMASPPRPQAASSRWSPASSAKLFALVDPDQCSYEFPR